MNNFYKDNEFLHRQFAHPMMREIIALREKNYTEKESVNHAPANFEEAIKQYDSTLNILGGICADTIAKNAAAVDQQGASCKDGRVSYAEGMQEDHRVLTEASLYGMSLPRYYGGLNFPAVVTIMATEMIARADAAMVNIWSLQDCAETINEFGDDELKSEFLPRVIKGETCSMDLTEATAGSDLQSISLRASWDEELQMWRLNGTKRFITNGDADIKLVLARSEEGTTDARGLSLFVYHRSWGGVSVRRIEHKLGIKGSPTCEVIFDNAPAKLIGNRRLGLIKYIFSLMNRARIGIGAQSVGISEAVLRETRKYASKRKQFGQPIIELPAVAEIISVMQAKLDASRALLYETGRFVDLAKGYSEKAQNEGLSTDERNRYKWAQRNADMLTPILKLSASEYCNQITYDAIQVLGGAGVLENLPVARLYRDARVTTIYEGTSQLQVVAASKYITNGDLASSIRERISAISESDIAERFTHLADEFEQIAAYCIERGDNFLQHHQRRLVEMGSHIIMSLLLYSEQGADTRTKQSFRHYLALCEAWNIERKRYIEIFEQI